MAGEEGHVACRGFWWLGQGFEHCDNCGRDIREHDGLHDPGPLFSKGQERVIPFPDAMLRSPLFAHYVTPLTKSDGPLRWQPEAGHFGGSAE